MDYTYEVSTNEPMHPDNTVRARMVEMAISTCENGCKIYGDPRSSLKVLAHNSAYGCRK